MFDLDENVEKNLIGIFDKSNYKFAAKEYILENIHTVFYNNTDYEKSALSELIKLIYYKGVIDEIFEINYA